MKKKNGYFIAILSLTVLTALILACWKIGQPGLYYDEMLFTNAAVGGKTDNFIRLRILGMPVLLMDYIGALKAWIYYPVFSIFPVNAWTLRLPSILLGIAGGVALVGGLWRGFGRSAATAGAVMILLDPTLITHSRLDWGPNALMFFFRGLMILGLVGWIRTMNPKWAWLAFAAAALGIFDKLNFIWIVCAAIGSLILIYPGKLKMFACIHPRQALALAGLGAAGLTVAIMRAITLSESMEVDWAHRIPYALNLLRYTLSGGGALNFISGDGLRLEGWIWPGYLVAGIVGCWGLKPLFKNADDRRLFLWTVALLMLVGTAFIATKSATGPHHSSMLSGPWQFAFAPLLGAVWNNYDQRFRRIRFFAVTAALIMIFAGNVIANVICIRAFAKPINANWDIANTAAALFAKKHPDAYYISTDWGIGTQVIAVTKDHPGIWDAWPSFTKQEDAENNIKNMQRDRDTYIYTRLPGFENFKGNRANLMYALEKNHISYEVDTTYADWSGRAMIEILRVKSDIK